MGKFIEENSQTVFDKLTKFRILYQQNPGNSVYEKTIKSLEDKFEKLHNLSMKKMFNTLTGIEIDYEDWLKWAYSKYSIKNSGFSSYTVISTCLSEPGEWEFNSIEESKLKIEKLVGYKIQDRNRGIGDMYKDLGIATISV